MTSIATFCLVQIKIAEVVIPQRTRLVMKATVPLWQHFVQECLFKINFILQHENIMIAPLLRLQFAAGFFNNLPSPQKAVLWFAASAVMLRAPVSEELQGV